MLFRSTIEDGLWRINKGAVVGGFLLRKIIMKRGINVVCVSLQDRTHKHFVFIDRNRLGIGRTWDCRTVAIGS